MAWENRKGRRYYYRKRRVGNRVVSEYVGGGAIGELAHRLDRLNRQERLDRRRELLNLASKHRAQDAAVDRLSRLTRAITADVLIVSGFHTHKRQWRRLRVQN